MKVQKIVPLFIGLLVQSTKAAAFGVNELYHIKSGRTAAVVVTKTTNRRLSLQAASSENPEINEATTIIPLTTTKKQKQQEEKKTIVEQCYDSFNNRDIEGMMECFDDTCSYEDTLFDQSTNTSKSSGSATGSVVTKEQLRIRFLRAINTLPPTINVVVDNIAADGNDGNDGKISKIGVQWHLEASVGSASASGASSAVIQLPFTRGCSFYTINTETDRIQTGFRVMETPFKPDDAIFNLLIVPTRIMETTTDLISKFPLPLPIPPLPQPLSPFLMIKEKKDNGQQEKSVPTEFRSILDKAMYLWNIRDIDRAVDECFTDDIVLEDTLYWKSIRGMEELRQHYQRVVQQLPYGCKIVIDDIVNVPPTSSLSKTKQCGYIASRWHIEMIDPNNNEIQETTGDGGNDGGGGGGGLLLPGWSRGCSMYTIEPETGLIQSAIDITESPTKIDEKQLNRLLSLLGQ